MSASRRPPSRPSPLPTGGGKTSAQRLTDDGGLSEKSRKSHVHIRPAEERDDDFILSLVERFVDFELPAWRKRSDSAHSIRRDLKRALDELPASENLFVAENESGERLGFLRVQKTRDFFSGRANCHISDIAVAKGSEGRGVGRALLTHAQAWAKKQRCALITLAVFPGNIRALALYERVGFGSDLLRLAKPVK